MSQDLLYEVKDRVATITLNGPDKLNAFTRPMIEAWARALADAQQDDHVNVVVVTGAGRAFCAGGDVARMGEGAPAPLDHKNELWEHIHQIPRTLEAMDKPVIAMVNGVAVGAGMGMCLMCDLRIASDEARFSTGYVKVGLVPGDGDTYFLPRLIGTARALELLWTSDFVDAIHAERLGIVNHVVPASELHAYTYGLAAPGVRSERGGCSGATASRAECDPITSNLHAESETSAIPAEAVAASLGCGNPTALVQLSPGETVLDLGSGGGIDVLLSARRVGPTGKAYGLDMTDEMLALARENQRKAGVSNVEFLKGEIEAIPLPDNSVDVIISNCVINLSVDKSRVFAEAFRVLRPGGRFAVSDVVVRGEVPAQIRRSVELWIGCVAGALEHDEYRAKLAKAGFEGIDLEPTRVYRVEDAREFLAKSGIDGDAIAPQVDGKFMSALVRARKPLAG